MKKVLVFGTFDGVHPGHEFLLKQAKKHGDYLIAVIGTDKTVQQVKGKSPKFKQHQRLLDVYAVPEVDEALIGTDKPNKAEIILDIKPDVICLGYDQTAFVDQLKQLIQEKNLPIKIITLPPYHPDKYKSSILNKEPKIQFY